LAARDAHPPVSVAVAILAPWTWLHWPLAVWVVDYVLRAKREVYRGSRWRRVLRGFFVAVVYGILRVFATIARIFPAIRLR
jgi:hypothetical protein